MTTPDVSPASYVLQQRVETADEGLLWDVAIPSRRLRGSRPPRYVRIVGVETRDSQISVYEKALPYAVEHRCWASANLQRETLDAIETVCAGRRRLLVGEMTAAVRFAFGIAQEYHRLARDDVRQRKIHEATARGVDFYWSMVLAAMTGDDPIPGHEFEGDERHLTLEAAQREVLWRLQSVPTLLLNAAWVSIAEREKAQCTEVYGPRWSSPRPVLFEAEEEEEEYEPV